jgi:glycosyltransferase involved in cell wall biosynthesis
VRISVVDPAAYTPPYDRALCAALAAEGLEVELLTRPFRHGDLPAATPGYVVREDVFGATRAHPLRMAALGRRARGDVLHFQWLPLQELDQLLLPRGRPLVLTAHDVLPREPRRFQLRAQRRLYDRVDAVVAHTEHSRGRLLELGIPDAKVRVIPHGAFTHLAATRAARPPELPETTRPVVLFFGLLRPYKGLDVLLEAWRAARPDAELWVVGAPRMALPPMPEGVRLVPRFVSEAEAAWCFTRADLVVLPYREIEGSGVLFTALGAGKATVVSDVGGFGELGGGVAHVPPGDPTALAATLTRLLEDPVARGALAAAAAQAAATTFAWGPIARAHRTLYEELRPTG